MVASWGALEWSFIVLVGGLTAGAGVFSLYLLLQSFRNSGFRRGRRRSAG